MPKFRRTDRINEQLKQEISILIRDEVADPRVGLVTVTGVQTSPELDHAKVYFTALGDEDERKDILVGLRSAAPFIRHELGKRLHMRRIPELHFEVDRILAEAMRIEQLLREALPFVPTPDEGSDDDVDAADIDAVDQPDGASGDDDGASDDDDGDPVDRVDAVDRIDAIDQPDGDDGAGESGRGAA